MKYVLYNLPKQIKKHTGVLCLSCGWIRLSFHGHDYVVCPCPNKTMVDGGHNYLRYGGVDLNKIQIVTVAPIKEKK